MHRSRDRRHTPRPTGLRRFGGPLLGHGVVAVLAMLVGAQACGDTYPQETLGSRIAGAVTYGGAGLGRDADPALSVAAFATFPPQGPPHASVTLRRPAFAAGPVSYELYGVPAHRYFVVAELVDFTVGPGRLGAPLGAYPNYCELLRGGVGNVTSTPERATTDIDIVLYDQGGALDPCLTGVADPCPKAGRGTLVWRVSSSLQPEDIAPVDRLDFVAFSTWPPRGPPLVYSNRSGAAISFPAEAVANDVRPGSVAAYACLNIGGDDVRTLCTEEDRWAAVPESGALSLQEGEVLTLAFDIDAGAAVVESQVTGASIGCGP